MTRRKWINELVSRQEGLPGAEVQQLAETHYTQCRLHWGKLPCEADGEEPCYRSIVSCQDPENFSPEGRAFAITRGSFDSGGVEASQLEVEFAALEDARDALTIEVTHQWENQDADPENHPHLHALLTDQDDNVRAALELRPTGEPGDYQTEITIRVGTSIDQTFLPISAAKPVTYVLQVSADGLYALVTPLAEGQPVDLGAITSIEDVYTSGPAHGEGDFAFHGAAKADDGRIILAPYGSDNIGIFDPSDNSYTSGPAHGEGDSAFRGAAKADDGRIILAPYGSDNIGIFDLDVVFSEPRNWVKADANTSVAADRFRLDKAGPDSFTPVQAQMIRLWRRFVLPWELERNLYRHEPEGRRDLVAQWSGAMLDSGTISPDAGVTEQVLENVVGVGGGSAQTRPSLLPEDSDPLRLLYSMHDRVLPPGVDAQPALVSARVAPSEIKIGELGSRGTASAVLEDFEGDDRDLDPFIDHPARMSAPKGSHVTRLRARQPYHHRRDMIIYTGAIPRWSPRAVPVGDVQHDDGAGLYVDLTTQAMPDLAGGETLLVQMWLNVEQDSASPQPVIGLHNGDGFQGGNWVLFVEEGDLKLTADGVTVSVGGIALHRWHDIEVRISSTEVTLAVNGNEMTAAGAITLSPAPAERLFLSSDHGENHALIAHVADLRVWISPQGEEQHFKGRFISHSPASLRGWWPFLVAADELHNESPAFLDFSGRGYTAMPSADGAIISKASPPGVMQASPEGQDLIESLARHLYLMEKVTGPGWDNQLRIRAKDPIAWLGADKVKLPAASRGLLGEPIQESDGAGTVFGVEFPVAATAVLPDSEYPDGQFKIRMGREHMLVTREAGSRQMEIVDRAVDNTEVSSHDQGDTVQLALDLSGRTDELMIRLLEASPTSRRFIPYGDMTAEADAFLPRIFSATISEPTDIQDLISELMQTAGIDFWWDDREATFRMIALKEPPEQRPTLDWQTDIRARTFSLEDASDDIVTQAWIWYGQLNPTEGVNQSANYRSVTVAPRFSEEGSARLRDSHITEFHSRWIGPGQKPAADDAGQLLLRRLGGLPFRVRFEMFFGGAVDLWTGDVFDLTWRGRGDFSGAESVETMQVLSAREREPGYSYEIEAQLYAFVALPDDNVNIIEFSFDVPAQLEALNLRDVHDSQFADMAPRVIFRVLPGVTVYNVETGTFPAGTEVVIENFGRIGGPGGAGGDGARMTPEPTQPSTPGEQGGLALRVDYPVTFDNRDGEILGGGGGGGGGGGVTAVSSFGFFWYADGSGGGGGEFFGDGGDPGDGDLGPSGAPGEDGSQSEPGEGGASQCTGDSDTTVCGGAGGGGGVVGEPGDAGEDATASGDVEDSGFQDPSPGGDVGPAIEGVSLITWVDGDQGTIVGSTSG